MNDQWVETGTPFRLVDLCDGAAVGGVSAQAVNRFSWERQQITPPHNPGGLVDVRALQPLRHGLTSGNYVAFLLKRRSDRGTFMDDERSLDDLAFRRQ